MAGAPDEEGSKTDSGERARQSLPSFVRRFGPVIGLLALALGIAWFSGLFSRDKAPSQEKQRSPAPAQNAALNDTLSVSRLEQELGDLDKLPAEIQHYLAKTVYPPGTGQLTREHVDLLEPNRRHEEFRPIPETMSTNPDEVVSVRLTSERYFYTGDEPVNVDLDIRIGARPIRPISLDTALFREGRGGDEGRPVSLRFVEEGTGYAARIDTSRFADHHGNLRLDVRLEYAAGQFHNESLRLFLTPEGMIPARFSGEMRDEVAGGNLRVQVGIRVEQAGFYRIDANLYDRSGEPVAFSAFKGNLTRSDQEVPIDFFGRLLRDVNSRGPYSVTNVRGYRFIDGGHPDRERIPDLEASYRTQFEDLSLVSEEAYAGADKLRTVALMLEDVANGIGLDMPPSPGSPPENSITTSIP